MEVVKFISSEKATKVFEIFTLLLSYVVPVKSKVKISQNFKAFSEYTNFTRMGFGSKLYLTFSVIHLKKIDLFLLKVSL